MKYEVEVPDQKVE